MLFLRSFSQLRYSARRDWLWLAALALLSFALSIALLNLPALRLQNERLARQMRTLESQLRAAPQAAVHEPAVDLNKQLPSFERLVVIVQDLHSLANQHGLSISEANYTAMEHAVDGKNADTDDIQRIEIQAKLNGNYLPLKSSLDRLLAAHDGLTTLALINPQNTNSLHSPSQLAH